VRQLVGSDAADFFSWEPVKETGQEDDLRPAADARCEGVQPFVVCDQDRMLKRPRS
jgi:hypothetical protein